MKLNLVQVRAEGRWYFAGLQIPPALAAVRVSDGKPCDDDDAVRVNAAHSMAIAGVTTRYFPTADAGLAAARELGHDGDVAVLPAPKPTIPPLTRKAESEEDMTTTKAIKTKGARVALKDGSAHGEVTRVNKDHSVRVLFDGAAKDKIVKVGDLVPQMREHDEAAKAVGPATATKAAQAAKPAKATKPQAKANAAKAVKTAAAPKPATAKKPAPQRDAKPKREPLPELSGAAFKRVLSEFPAIRSPHHAEGKGTRKVLYHLDSGDAWNGTGRYSVCRTKLTKFEQVPNQGKLEPTVICDRCLPRAQRAAADRAAK